MLGLMDYIVELNIVSRELIAGYELRYCCNMKQADA